MLEKTYNQNYDIAGQDVLTYKGNVASIARVRSSETLDLVPVLGDRPQLSVVIGSCFITSTTYSLAVNLVDSM